MTKGAALQSFFESIMPAYAETSVPDDAAFPYLTYQLSLNAWESGETALAINMWFRTPSEAIPNAKAQELSDAIGYSGITIPCDGGFIWLKRGSPWCQSMRDESDSMIKRRYINVIAEYFTLN